MHTRSFTSLRPLLLLLSFVTASAQLTRESTTVPIAGSGSAGYSATDEGGAALSARLNSPQGVALDAFGDMYIADTANNRVRRISSGTGAITTIAGNGTAGYRAADENVIATNGELNLPQGLCLDGLGNLYIADTGNHRVRKVVLSTGLMSTVAGAGGTTYNQQEQGSPTAMNIAQPVSVAADAAGNIYIADAGLNRVFLASLGAYTNGVQQGRIATFAGTSGSGVYTTASAEENVIPTLAHLNAPRGVALDRYGNIYIADTGNNRLRKVTIVNSTIKLATLAGNGDVYSAATEGAAPTGAGIGPAISVALDVPGNVYFSTGNRVLRFALSTTKVATYTGDGNAGYSDNTLPRLAEFSAPAGLALNAAGTIFIADSGNHRIRSAAVATGNVLFAHTGVGSSDVSQALVFTAKTDLTITSISVLTPTGKATEFAAGTAIGCSAGAAMTAGSMCAVPLTFTPAQPGRRRVPLQIVTSAGTQRFGLSGFALGAQVISSPQVPVPFAGADGGGAYVASEDNGPATAAHFYTVDFTGVDAADNVYVADNRQGRIRKVTPSTGLITTVAGSGSGTYSSADEGATATTVSLTSPNAIVVDAAGNLFIGGQDGRIRRVDAATGKITTIAGNGGSGNPGDNVAATSTPAFATGLLVVDEQGNVWQTSTTSGGTRRIDAATGITTAVIGTNATYATTNLQNCTACTGRPVVDESGNLYLASSTVYRINSLAGNFTATTGGPTSVQWAGFAPGGNLLMANATSLFQFNLAANTLSTVATYTPSPSYASPLGSGFALDSLGNAIYQNGGTYQLAKTNGQQAKVSFAGTTVVGQASQDSPKALNLFNVGSLPYTLATPSSGANPLITSDFQLANSSTCPQLSAISAPSSLPAGTGCTYNLNFIPVAPGTVNGTAVFNGNQFGVPGTTMTFLLTGAASGTAVTTSLGLSGLTNAIAGTAQTVTVTAYSGTDQTHVATNYTGTVTFSTSDTNTGVLPAAYTFTATDAGVHTFTVTLKAANTSASVTVADRSNSALTANARAKITAAAAVSIAAVNGTPQSADTNAQFATLLRAKVADTYGNGVPGVSVTYAAPATGASVTFSTYQNVSVTDDSGEATTSATANGTTGSYSVTATAAGLRTPAYFQLTNNTPVSSFTVTGNTSSFGYGPDIRLTANITPRSINGHDATGTVTFYEGSTVLSTQTVNLANGSPTYLVPAPSVGSHTYTASYTGDLVYPATARGVSTAGLTVSKGQSYLDVPFTKTVVRPGSFTVSVGNAADSDSSTKAYMKPTGSVGYTINPQCGAGTPLTGALPLTNGSAIFTVPADCAARGYSIDYTYAGDSNYNAETNARNTALTVTAQIATITITNTDQVYDGTPKSVTVTTNPAGLSYSVAYGGSVGNQPPTYAGSFPVHVTLTDPNYTGSADSTLLVRRGPVQISWLYPAAIVYGTPLSTAQLSAATSVQGTFAYNPIAGTVLTPGTQQLTVTFTPADSPNTPTSATVPLVVTKADLLVKAIDAGRNYGAANPAFSAMVNGAVNGDTFTTGGTTTATPTSPVGTYPIMPTVAGANLAYYNVTYTNGTLTVSGTPATVTLSNLNQVYDGTPRAVTVTTMPANLAVNVTYNGSTTVPTDAGSYAVVVTVTDPNYTGTANGVLTVSAGSSTIVWNPPAAITYGTALSAAQLNATASGPGTFVYTPAAGTILQPGVQTLSVTFTPTGSNTTATTRTVPLTVNKAALTVTAANVSRAFGAANPALPASVTGAVNGDQFSATGTTSATVVSPVGSYAITPVLNGINQGAYTVTLVSGVLTVLPIVPNLTLVSDKPTTFVGDTVTFTATVASSGAQPSGSVEFFNGATSLGVKALTAGTASVSTASLAAGTYNITATYTGDMNYAPGTSAIVVETIFTSDYTVSVNPTVLTIHRGQSGTAIFTVTPTGNFHDAVSFTCGSLPTYATCVFSPTSITPNGAPVNTTLTISTTAEHAANTMLPSPWHSTGGALLAAAFCTILGWRRRRSLPALLLLALSALAASSLTGCAMSAPTTPAGSYAVSIGAAASGSGTHGVNLTVNIVD